MAEKKKYEFAVNPGVDRIILSGELWQKCAVCDRLVPFEEIGLRHMEDLHTVRNQPRCGHCRKVKVKKHD